MEKIHKSQLVKASVLLLLLLLTPFLSTSIRPSYLYFLFNILILSLGIEAGFLTAISGPHEEKKSLISAAVLPQAKVEEIGEMEEAAVIKKPSAVAEKIVAGAAMAVNKLNKCPSMPSLFFIGSYETEGEEEMEFEFEKEEKVMTEGEELFSKAEMFISNFYKQLKMQREESWKRIHGLYHKAF